MRILVLGGTWFLGREVVAEAVRRGWQVTTFSRGRSGVDHAEAETLRGDRTVQADLVRLAGFGPWDAVLDTSSSEMSPQDVLMAARALEEAAGRWIHVSTVSVYAGWPHKQLTELSPLLEAPAHADSSFGYTSDDGSPTKYGFQKAGGEAAVRAVFGGRSVFLRPGVILGPGEYVGRLPWWLTRASRGGRILVPSPAELVMQPVDVRDVAEFALDQAVSIGVGAYNISHPVGITWGEFIAQCLRVTEASGVPVWAEPRVLFAHGVKQWTELPLWRTHAGVWAVDPTRAVAAGLRCRPIAETIEQTWAWLQGNGHRVDHPRWAEHGLDEMKEKKILATIGQ